MGLSWGGVNWDEWTFYDFNLHQKTQVEDVKSGIRSLLLLLFTISFFLYSNIMARRSRKSAQSTASNSHSIISAAPSDSSQPKRNQQHTLPPVLRYQPTVLPHPLLSHPPSRQSTTVPQPTHHYPLTRLATSVPESHKHWNDMTLSRFSSQIRGISRQSTIVPEYEPFKTLNTRQILAPISAPSPHQESTLNSTNALTQYSQVVRPSRTLAMMSDYQRHVERMNKISSNAARIPFADSHYETQYWRNKERGGPINRKYSAGKHQSLMDRHRIRQKTMLSGVAGSGDIPLQSIQRAFDYQQYAKTVLRNS